MSSPDRSVRKDRSVKESCYKVYQIPPSRDYEKHERINGIARNKANIVRTHFISKSIKNKTVSAPFSLKMPANKF